MLKIVAFLVLSLPLIYVSWRTLFSPDKHGLYRFITWELVLWIAVHNSHYLLVEEFNSRQVLSSLLMITSALLVVWSFIVMRREGRVSPQREDATLFGFEKTTTLVTSGVFGYIRHPMYTSLLCLLWGVLLRNVEMALLLVAVLGTLTCITAALIEERENLEYFGEPYRQYMRSSKRFIPFLL
ncbi:MAG TPA: methyltransferase [Pelovirga sp.]|nr:methyltransferase [Pelovirga sp.]